MSPAVDAPDRYGQVASAIRLLIREKIPGFVVIGIISTLLDIGLLYYLTEYLNVWYLLSAAISYSCGMVVNFLLNKFLNFKDTNHHYLYQFATFALISSTSLAITLGIIYAAVALFSANYLIAKILAIIVSFAWNYLGQSRITFSLGKHRISGDRRDHLR